MSVTLFGIVISVKFSHHANASKPIDVTLSGIVIVFNLSQPLKVLSSIYFTPYGIVTFFISLENIIVWFTDSEFCETIISSILQFSNALLEIFSILSETVTVLKAEQL